MRNLKTIVLISALAGIILSITACGDDLAAEPEPDGSLGCLSQRGSGCITAPDAYQPPAPDAAPIIPPADAVPFVCADHCPAPGTLTECTDCQQVCQASVISTCAACPEAMSVCDNGSICKFAPPCSTACPTGAGHVECDWSSIGGNVCACVTDAGDRHTCTGGV